MTRRGPPPASPDGARNRRLSIPVTDIERERIRAAAGPVPLATWCRGVVMARVGDEPNWGIHALPDWARVARLTDTDTDEDTP